MLNLPPPRPGSEASLIGVSMDAVPSADIGGVRRPDAVRGAVVADVVARADRRSGLARVPSGVRTYSDRERVQLAVSVCAVIACAAEVPLMKGGADSLAPATSAVLLYFFAAAAQALVFAGTVAYRRLRALQDGAPRASLWPRPHERSLIAVVSACDCASLSLILVATPHVHGHLLPVLLQARFVLFAAAASRFGLVAPPLGKVGVVLVVFGGLLALAENFGGVVGPAAAAGGAPAANPPPAAAGGWWHALLLAAAAATGGAGDAARCAYAQDGRAWGAGVGNLGISRRRGVATTRTTSTALAGARAMSRACLEMWAAFGRLAAGAVMVPVLMELSVPGSGRGVLGADGALARGLRCLWRGRGPTDDPPGGGSECFGCPQALWTATGLVLLSTARSALRLWPAKRTGAALARTRRAASCVVPLQLAAMWLGSACWGPGPGLHFYSALAAAVAAASGVALFAHATDSPLNATLVGRPAESPSQYAVSELGEEEYNAAVSSGGTGQYMIL